MEELAVRAASSGEAKPRTTFRPPVGVRLGEGDVRALLGESGVRHEVRLTEWWTYRHM